MTYARAGDPARIEITAGRVFLPYGDSRDTAADRDAVDSAAVPAHRTASSCPRTGST
ncbi:MULTISPECIES: hypothetical protein [unclassified Streptomyces]|uniref:hypothetical protein n=1 Tax=unclassified Streptomyces TaxID=2593676 RepID=UPI003656681B